MCPCGQNVTLKLLPRVLTLIIDVVGPHVEYQESLSQEMYTLQTKYMARV